ncbi:hypothetical protein [Mesorhizobium sp.]|uniref:hypothetical protein n=1 Tax=Mesorhizobium sp. TaxID=1871066 RepID=UPI0025C25D71|nr:hypothetical protein [Mesorhizobium sp.]
MSIDLSLGRAYKWNVPINQEPFLILNPAPKCCLAATKLFDSTAFSTLFWIPEKS